MLFYAMCFRIVLYCIVLYCPVLHCSTLPRGINPFAVNNNNNNNNRQKRCAKGSGKEVKIQEFMYRNAMNVELEMYDCTSNNWSHE